MRQFSPLITLLVLLLWVKPHWGQSGNQSDITAPNPVNIMPPQRDAATGADIAGPAAGGVDRAAYGAQLQQSSNGGAIALMEEYQAFEFCNFLELERCGPVPTATEIVETLGQSWQMTGQKSAFIYIVNLPTEIQIVAVFPGERGDPIDLETAIVRLTVATQSPREIEDLVRQFRRGVTNPRQSQAFLRTAQQLSAFLIEPLMPELAARDIDHLLFSLDEGLRLLPMGVLHDGEQFLIEQYGVSLIPSFGLVDIGYNNLRNANLLAMGASKFETQPNLEAVPLELAFISRLGWPSQVWQNEGFTVENFTAANQEQTFGIIHLATHAAFVSTAEGESYLQFSDRPLTLPELREIVRALGWTEQDRPSVELLILSACQTAVGDRQSELGFAGLAVQLGVKAALASLWAVSDVGTLALMSEYYQLLNENPNKPQALRQAQLNLLRGEVRLGGDHLVLSNGEIIPLTEALQAQGDLDLRHPSIWAGFQLVGDWH
ncbi:MAG: CHAT domain-containing protein [Spirulina sp. DLM2.Bin59]|nr:MAG: CHAT domain-containing protein [Spirulina sp. DLM2.Bin59]